MESCLEGFIDQVVHHQRDRLGCKSQVCESRVASYELRVASYELLVAGLRFARCKSRTLKAKEEMICIRNYKVNSNL